LGSSPTPSYKPNNRPRRSFLCQVTTDGDDMSAVDASVVKQSLATKILYTVGASTSSIVAITFFLVLAIQRDALMVAFFVGAIANGILSKVLKKILNQDRPSDAIVTSVAAVEQPSDKGMPSSHAMSLGFIGTFTMLTWEWTRLVIPVYAAISLYYRVQTRLHTTEQVVVGLVVGATNGYVWRHLVDGSNPFGINVTEYVSRAFLNDHGLLPIPLLIVPIVAGLVVVGSLERKISKFLQKKES
jgi:membrane-associated phospholipid phosphatase